MVACGLVERSDLAVWWGGSAGLICRVWSGAGPAGCTGLVWHSDVVVWFREGFPGCCSGLIWASRSDRLVWRSVVVHVEDGLCCLLEGWKLKRRNPDVIYHNEMVQLLKYVRALQGEMIWRKKYRNILFFEFSGSLKRIQARTALVNWQTLIKGRILLPKFVLTKHRRTISFRRKLAPDWVGSKFNISLTIKSLIVY